MYILHQEGNMSKWHRDQGVFNLVLSTALLLTFDIGIDYFKMMLHIISFVVNFRNRNYNFEQIAAFREETWTTRS